MSSNPYEVGIETDELNFTGTTGRSMTNNNPLNLEYRPGSYQDKYGAILEPVSKSGKQRFAKFATMEDGYNAGIDQIKLDASRGHTLASFVNKFAPPHENPTNQIIQQYADAIGANPDTLLSQINPEKLMVLMLARESSTKIAGKSNPYMVTEPGAAALEKKADATAMDVNPYMINKQDVNPYEVPVGETPAATAEVKSPIAPENILPGMAESGYPPSLAEKVISKGEMGISDLQQKLGTVINWPHKQVKSALGRLGIPEQQEIPVDTMLRPGEFGQVGGTPAEGTIQSPLRETMAQLIDPLAYTSISKLIGLSSIISKLIKPIASEAELANLVKGNIWDNIVSKVTQPTQEAFRLQAAKNAGQTTFDTEMALQRLRGETSLPVSIEELIPGIATKTPKQLAAQLKEIDFLARSKQPMAMSDAGQISGPLIIPGEAAWTPKASTLPPEASRIISPTQAGPYQSAGEILPPARVRLEVTSQTELPKIVANKIPVIGTGERGVVKRMYSGGPEFDDFLKAIQENHLKTGSYVAAVNIVASKYNIKPSEAIDILRRGSLVTNNPAENLASKVFPADKKLTDTAAYHEVHMQGVPLIKSGQTEFANIGPSKISLELPTPKRDVSAIESQIGADTVSRNVFGDKNNLVGDYFQSINHYRENSKAGLTVLDNLAADTGIHLDINASRVAVEKYLFPILERYKSAVSSQRELFAQVQSKQNILKHLDQATPEAQRLELEIVGLTKLINETPEVGKILAERDIMVSNLATVHPNIRTFLGAERSNIPLNEGELKFATETRKYLDHTADRMQSQGMRIFSGDKNYMPYIYQRSSNSTWFLGGRKGYPEFMDFLSRTPGSESWYPLAYQSMRQYIPVAEKKLAFNPLTTKWSPAIQGWKHGDFPGTADWAAKFLSDNLAPARMDFIDKAITFGVGTEYARTLWGNLAPALLHAFKVLVNVGYQGIGATGHGVVDFSQAVGQKIGKVFGGPGGKQQELLDHYMSGKELMSGIYQTRGLEEMLQPSLWQKIKAGINLPLKLSEYVGNGLNIFSSMARGFKAGASAETINREVLETMLRLDYRGFVMPPILTATKVKPLTMYLGQPAKRLENILDIGGSAGYELLYSLSKAAEKTGLIDHALTEPVTNMFGESYLPKFVRILALMGIADQVGKSYGLDLSKHLLHLPGSGYAKDTGEETLSLQTPPIELLGQLKEKGIKEGLRQHYGWAAPMKFFQEPSSKFDNNLLMQVLGVPKYGWQE